MSKSFSKLLVFSRGIFLSAPLFFAQVLTVPEAAAGQEALRGISLEEDKKMRQDFAVSVAAPDPLYSVLRPGESVVYHFRVENRGEIEDTYTITSTSAKGWVKAEDVPGELTLAPHKSSVVNVPVAAPVNASSGESDTITVLARSHANKFLADAASITLFVSQGRDGAVACPMDAKLCPDGSYVGREAPDCAFKKCPE